MGSVFVDRRSGRPIFSIAFRDVSGRMRRERTKAATRSLARRLLADKEDAVELARTRGLASIDNLKAGPVPTFKTFSERVFLPHCRATRAPATSTAYACVLRRNVYPVLGQKAIDTVRPSDLQLYVDGRRIHGKAAPRTIEKELGVLAAVFTAAVKRDIIGRSPARGIVRPRIEESTARCLTDAEIAALLAKASPHLGEIIRFCLEVGCRDAELRGLKWCDYDRQEATITLRGCKSHKDRAVPLSPLAQAVIESREAARGLPTGAASPFIFASPHTGGKWGHHFAGCREWNNLVRDSGVSGMHFHLLRHTCATKWIRQGVPLAAVQRLLGHHDITQTAGYARLDNADLRDAVSRGNLRGVVTGVVKDEGSRLETRPNFPHVQGAQ